MFSFLKKDGFNKLWDDGISEVAEIIYQDLRILEKEGKLKELSEELVMFYFPIMKIESVYREEIGYEESFQSKNLDNICREVYKRIKKEGGNLANYLSIVEYSMEKLNDLVMEFYENELNEE